MVEIVSLKKTINKKKLKIEVNCKERQFIAEPIKLLTTSELVSIILKEEENYKILSIQKEPCHKVGNSNRKSVKTHGTWLFEIESIENEKKVIIEEKEIEEKPKPKTRKTSSSSTKQEKSQPSPRKNIRGRISKLARSQED